MKPIVLAIIEDNPWVRESLQTYLNDHPEFAVALVADSVEAFLQALERGEPFALDMLLLDIQLPGMSGVAGIPGIRAALPQTDIVILTTFEDSDNILAALSAGACSYLSKQSALPEIADALRTVRQGGAYMSPGVARKVVEHFAQHPVPKTDEPYFSPRQHEIIQGIMDGLSYKMIAARHGISLDTVRSHIMHVYRTLQINNKVELIHRVQGWKQRDLKP